MWTMILVPIGIGVALGVALIALTVAVGAVWLLLCLCAGILQALWVRRMTRTAEGRAQWLAEMRRNPRNAARLDLIAARRAGDKAAIAAALARLRT